MARVLDYNSVTTALDELFAEAEQDFASGEIPTVPAEVADAVARLMRSKTAAHREAAVGCAAARLQDEKIDLSLPYAGHGDFAYNGRDLDKYEVNPFLQRYEIPCSKAPFLNVYRRSVKFTSDTRQGVRDKDAFDALLTFIFYLKQSDTNNIKNLLTYLLIQFIVLREEAKIPLRTAARISTPQFASLIAGLLSHRSGGRFPVLLAVALLQTLRDCYNLDWEIDHQEINVSDKASGVSGDITVRREGRAILAVEVTEQPIERNRIVSTFNTKISGTGLNDYLFVFARTPPADDARAQADRYYTAGHEINFIGVQNWVVTSMATIGPDCRAKFIPYIVDLLTRPGVPAAVKVAWNVEVDAILAKASP